MSKKDFSIVNVILTNYKRPENVRQLIDMLLMQTIPVNILVWDNAPKTPKKGFLDGVDIYHHSEENVGCYGRWEMATSYATDFTMILDDDLYIMRKDFVERMLEMYLIKSFNYPVCNVLGISGVLLERGKSYKDSTHVQMKKPFTEIRENSKKIPVSMVKGRCMLFNSKLLLKGDFTLTPFIEAYDKKDYFRCDDILFSSYAGYCCVWGAAHMYLKNLPEGREALSADPEHYKEREKVRQSLELFV